jgi:hypothetical protein
VSSSKFSARTAKSQLELRLTQSSQAPQCSPDTYLCYLPQHHRYILNILNMEIAQS